MRYARGHGARVSVVWRREARWARCATRGPRRSTGAIALRTPREHLRVHVCLRLCVLLVAGARDVRTARCPRITQFAHMTLWPSGQGVGLLSRWGLPAWARIPQVSIVFALVVLRSGDGMGAMRPCCKLVKWPMRRLAHPMLSHCAVTIPHAHTDAARARGMRCHAQRRSALFLRVNMCPRRMITRARWFRAAITSYTAARPTHEHRRGRASHIPWEHAPCGV